MLLKFKGILNFGLILQTQSRLFFVLLDTRPILPRPFLLRWLQN
jgi:hypothetical protein